MFRRFLNMFPPGDSLVITTDGAGAVALASNTAGIASVAFTTNGTDGQITVTIRQRGATYAVVGNAASATAPLALAQLGTPTATAFVVEVSDLATPTVVNLATTVTRINLHVG
jgi:hypothetical protein